MHNSKESLEVILAHNKNTTENSIDFVKLIMSALIKYKSNDFILLRLFKSLMENQNVVTKSN